MRTMTEERRENGYLTMKTFFAILGIAVTLVLVGFAYVGGRVESIEARADSLTANVADKGERIATVETKAKAVEERLGKIDDKLEKILDKLTQ